MNKSYAYNDRQAKLGLYITLLCNCEKLENLPGKQYSSLFVDSLPKYIMRLRFVFFDDQ